MSARTPAAPTEAAGMPEAEDRSTASARATAGAASSGAARHPSRSLTPTLGQRLRSGATWIWAIPVLLVVGLGIPLIQGLLSAESPRDLDPRSAAPAGAKAVVEVLRGQGVDVRLAAGLDEALAAPDPAATTLVIADSAWQLGQDAARAVLDGGFGHVVIVGSGAVGIFEEAGAPIQYAGYSDPEPVGTAGTDFQPLPVGTSCEPELAADAPAVSAVGGPSYQLADAERGYLCYGSAAEAPIVMAQLDDDRWLTVIGAEGLLINDRIDDHANAALALGLLGDEPSLVWFDTQLAPAEAVPGDAFGDHVPGWVTPAMLLLSAGILAAGMWRGRRFGPLVAERLPVVVRGSETLEGRARLYAASGSRLRAADALRIGALGRIASALNLGRGAGAAEIADALAAATGRPRDRVRYALLDAVPQGDEELVALSDELLELERALGASSPLALARDGAPSDLVGDERPDPSPDAVAARSAADGATIAPREDDHHVR